MHLIEMLAYRAIPAAGVSIGVTRRCPMNCAHCSTSSTMQSEQIAVNLLAGFVDTFSPASHPVFMALSGGEALLRPKLVKLLAGKARQNGTRASLLSGLYFARHGRIPKPIKVAIDAVDHFSVSMDAFHEKEVPRARVFNLLAQLLDEGKHLSVHIAGRDGNDPYLEDITTEIKNRFGQHIPMLVNTLSPFGRAKSIILNRTGRLFRRAAESDQAPNPCTMAAWPVVGFDGIVAACGNDNLIGAVPEHLKIGDIRVDGWNDIKTRCERGVMLRALRTYGPFYLNAQFQPANLTEANTCSGYCDTCIGFNGNKGLQSNIEQHFEKHGVHALSQAVTELQMEMGALNYAKRYSHPRYADLVLLGAET